MVQLQYDVITKEMLANVFTSTVLYIQGEKKNMTIKALGYTISHLGMKPNS